MMHWYINTIFQQCLETITDIQAYPQDDSHILSTSKDGTVRLWDVTSEKCLAVYDADATVSVRKHI
jgi:WD40 repeat protein